jgi:hypothetical protein
MDSPVGSILEFMAFNSFSLDVEKEVRAHITRAGRLNEVDITAAVQKCYI